jgi:hypothetical protein
MLITERSRLHYSLLTGCRPSQWTGAQLRGSGGCTPLVARVFDLKMPLDNLPIAMQADQYSTRGRSICPNVVVGSGQLRCAGYYDRETIALMTRAIDIAWREIELSRIPNDPLLVAIHTAMVRQIMAAVKNGERDLTRLKLAALSAIRRPGLCTEKTSYTYSELAPSIAGLNAREQAG